MIVRKPYLRASEIMQQRVKNKENIEILFETNTLGLVLGLESMYSDVKRASEDLLYLPMLNTPKMAFGGIVSDMNVDYDYTNNAQLTIETPLYINDREFARATYRANQNEINRHSKFNERLRGNR